MADEHEHISYWESFYAGDARARVPREASGFAQWVTEREVVPGPLVDIGTGTGRDAIWFARQGFRTVGLDYAEAAVRLASSLADEEGVDARFERLNLYHPEEVDELGTRLAAELTPRVVYARFFVHALEDDGRLNLWRLTRTLLRAGGRAYLEFRVGSTEHEFGEHYRHFVPPEVVAAEIAAEGGRVEHQQVGTGLAVYKHEDPPVCRLVAAWD
jgi:SAM-dependent methyltransferase